MGEGVKHPVQYLYIDESGVVRFKENKIVQFLLDAGPFDMNQLALMNFEDEDREHFAQLIGYSVSGFGDLDYVSDEVYELVGVEEFTQMEGRRDMTTSSMEKEIAERIREAAATYNDEVERAKILNIKVLTTPCPSGKLKIRAIQVFRELYKGEENG